VGYGVLTASTGTRLARFAESVDLVMSMDCRKLTTEEVEAVTGGCRTVEGHTRWDQPVATYVVPCRPPPLSDVVAWGALSAGATA